MVWICLIFVEVYCYVHLHVYIPTYGQNSKFRNVVRNSYGKVTGNWSFTFIIGLPVTDEIMNEMVYNNDIIVGNFTDTVSNYRLKLKCMLSHWNGADYLFKVSEGTLLNVHALMALTSTLNQTASLVGGSFLYGLRTPRSGVNFVPRRAYANSTLPPVPLRAGYLISAVAARVMYLYTDQLLTTKLSSDSYFISVLSYHCNVSIWGLNSRYVAFPNRESIILSRNFNWLVAHSLVPDDMEFLHKNLLYKMSLPPSNLTLNWPDMQLDILPKLDDSDMLIAYQAALRNGSAETVYQNDQNLDILSTNLTLRLLSFFNEERVVHSNVEQHAYRARELFNNSWVNKYCPQVANHFSKAPYFDYYNPKIGGSIALSTIAAESSVCLLHIFGVIANLVNIPWMVFAGTHLGAILHGGPM